MNKPTISLAEMAHRIVLEKKFNKMIAEITSAMKASTQMLNEAGLPAGIDQSILAASKEVEAAGENVADPDVQAAMVMAALEKGGDISKVDAQDVETVMQKQVKEGKQSLRESEGGVLAIVEGISVILGNLALVEIVCEKIEKVTGKKLDPNKFVAAVNKLSGFIKKVTGFPMKAFGNAIAWIIKKLGGGKSAQKIGKLTVKMLVVISLFALGIAFFPLAGLSLMGIVLSVTALIGKGFELAKLLNELAEALDEAQGRTGSEVGSFKAAGL